MSVQVNGSVVVSSFIAFSDHAQQMLPPGLFTPS